MIYDTYSIFWREMKRYKKSKNALIIRLIQPVVWMVVIGNTFAETQPLIQSVGFAGKYIEFMIPGVVVLTAITTSIFGGVNILWDRKYGFMNKALMSPISRSSLALGKILAISLISALQTVMILGIALAIGVEFSNFLVIIPIMAIVILFSLGFSAISVTIAASVKSQDTFWGMINFLGMPLFMLSPALFPLSLLPDWLETLARLNPVTYTVLLVREMMTGVGEGVSVVFSISVIAGFVLVTVLAASYVFTREVNKPF